MIGSTCSDWGRVITLRANLLVALPRDLIFSARLHRGCLESSLLILVVAASAREFSAISGGGTPDSLCSTATGVVFQTGDGAFVLVWGSGREDDEGNPPEWRTRCRRSGSSGR